MVKKVFYSLIGILLSVMILLNIFRLTAYMQVTDSMLDSTFTHKFFVSDFDYFFSFKSLFTITDTLPYVSFNTFVDMFSAIGNVFVKANTLSDWALLILFLPIIPVLPVIALISVLLDLVLWFFNLIVFVFSGSYSPFEYPNITQYIISILNILTKI